jgi:membrane associated rhomboid family serine protease
MIPLRDNVHAHHYPLVNVALIWVNVAVFLYEFSLGPHLEEFFSLYAVVPRQILTGTSPEGLLPLLTSMFLHGGFLHLAGNMLFLWIFGDNVEDKLGHLRYLFFYLFCGLAASAAHVFVNQESMVPSVGASGAIAGVLGGYMLMFPQARVAALVFFFLFIDVIELPAVLYIGFWFVMQLFNGVASLPGAHLMQGGVAWWAHVGGFVAGFLFVKAFCAGQPKRRCFDDEYWAY